VSQKNGQLANRWSSKKSAQNGQNPVLIIGGVVMRYTSTGQLFRVPMP
jgi:hypothetical protein